MKPADHVPDATTISSARPLFNALLIPLTLLGLACEPEQQATIPSTDTVSLATPIAQARSRVHSAAVAIPPPPESALALITSAQLRTFATALASDRFEGRKTGTPGIDKARRYILDQLDAAKRSAPDLNISEFAFEIPGKGAPQGPHHNIIAWLPGTDPDLKEVVVLGAHYDHIGVSRRKRLKDRIFNGADDNASGTSAALVTVIAIARSGYRTRRHMVFIWFSGEEQGLFGSSAWTKRPDFPLSHTAAMINLDMIGRNPDKPATLFGLGTSSDLPAIVQKARLLAPDATVITSDGLGDMASRSDHKPFLDEDVPVLFLHTGLHPDYHAVTDHVEHLDFPNLTRLTRLSAALMISIADYTSAIRRNPG